MLSCVKRPLLMVGTISDMGLFGFYQYLQFRFHFIFLQDLLYQFKQTFSTTLAKQPNVVPVHPPNTHRPPHITYIPTHPRPPPHTHTFYRPFTNIRNLQTKQKGHPILIILLRIHLSGLSEQRNQHKYYNPVAEKAF